VVLFAMRRVISDRDLNDNNLMAIVATIRNNTGSTECNPRRGR